jgi:hypothetical protein
MEPWSEAIRNKSEGVKNWDSRSSGDISKVIESRLLTSIGHRALQVNENDSGFSSSAVIGKKVTLQNFINIRARLHFGNWETDEYDSLNPVCRGVK